jgi:hypothetical protein
MARLVLDSFGALWIADSPRECYVLDHDSLNASELSEPFYVIMA